MSLMTMRLNERKKNAFLSDCFNFTWLGKYKVHILFSKNNYSVFFNNFEFFYGDFDSGDLPYVVSSFGFVGCHKFFNVKDAIDYFNLVCYTLINDFGIKSKDDFDEFFDLNRLQGFQEWLPELHHYFK